MTRAHRSLVHVTVFAAITASCAPGPDYPADWPALQPRREAAQGCPDLSGRYVLPRAIKARVRKEPAQIVYPHTFLTAVAGRESSGRQSSTPAPSRLDLEGPSDAALTVRFFDRRGSMISEHQLREGIDYVCRGAWISDPAPPKSRATPTRLYAKDVDGRLVGHTEFSGTGLVFVLGVIPVPAYVDDASWWRLEPDDATAP